MKHFFTALIRAYRYAISPLLGPSCRYYPSCSQYALDAFGHYGVFKALSLSIWRILRCNPFSKGGYDPAVSEECCHARTDINDRILRTESSGD